MAKKIVYYATKRLLINRKSSGKLCQLATLPKRRLHAACNNRGWAFKSHMAECKLAIEVLNKDSQLTLLEPNVLIALG
jgi:hypothetical protein